MIVLKTKWDELYCLPYGMSEWMLAIITIVITIIIVRSYLHFAGIRKYDEHERKQMYAHCFVSGNGLLLMFKG